MYRPATSRYAQLVAIFRLSSSPYKPVTSLNISNIISISSTSPSAYIVLQRLPPSSHVISGAWVTALRPLVGQGATNASATT